MISAKYRRALKLAKKPKPNIAAALKLLESALKEGSPHAAWALGTWYLHGVHVPKDLRYASLLLRKAAKAKLPDANYELAVCYELGEGVKKNLKKAVLHYLTAALYGNAQGMRELGRCYWHGIGIGRNRSIGQIVNQRSKELGANN